MSENDAPAAKVRVRAEDFGRLNDLKKDPTVKELAAEEGYIKSPDHFVSYGTLLRLLIPEDAEPMSRQMEQIPIYPDDVEVQQRIMDLAGASVDANDVVHRYTDEFIEQYDIEVSYE